MGHAATHGLKVNGPKPPRIHAPLRVLIAFNLGRSGYLKTQNLGATLPLIHSEIEKWNQVARKHNIQLE